MSDVPISAELLKEFVGQLGRRVDTVAKQSLDTICRDASRGLTVSIDTDEEIAAAQSS
jgi:hypothetical protein